MKICTRTWFDGVKMYEKGEEYLGELEKGHFEESEVSPKEEKDNALLKNVKAALQLLDHEDNKQWTMQDLPVVKVVEEILGGGVTVSRSVIEEAFPGFKRDMKPLGKEKVMKT